jgi:hypothetical protein
MRNCWSMSRYMMPVMVVSMKKKGPYTVMGIKLAVFCYIMTLQNVVYVLFSKHPLFYICDISKVKLLSEEFLSLTTISITIHSHNYGLLGCEHMQSSRQVLPFQRNLLPSSSEQKKTEGAGSSEIMVPIYQTI